MDIFEESLLDDFDFFDEQSVFGNPKIDRPKNLGLKAAIDADDMFIDAVDIHTDNIDLSFHDAFDKEFFFTDGDALFEETFEDDGVDITSVPEYTDEIEQFDYNEDDIGKSEKISDNELAKDIEESVGWDDLY